MELNDFKDLAVSAVQGTLPAIIGGYAAILTLKITDKKPKRQSLDFTDMSEALQPFLDSIRDMFDACRVMYWEGHNGTYTLSDYSIKKLSAMCESVSDGCKPIMSEMQSIPAFMSRRTLKDLRECEEDFLISNEWEKFDDEAQMYMAHGIRKVLIFKVFVRRKYVGIVTVGFQNHEAFIDTEHTLARAKYQIGRMSEVIKELTE